MDKKNTSLRTEKQLEITNQTIVTSSLSQIKQTLQALFCPGDVVELRFFPGGTKSGYFTDMDKLAKAAVKASGTAPGIYVTLNPVKAELLSQSENRVKSSKTTTSDADIEKRSWLPIDFDPIRRPKGTSSTDQEHELALELAKNCKEWLGEQGFPAPILGDSGNGAHLLYKIDLPNDDSSRDLIKRCILALDQRFTDEAIDVDKKVFNAARIWKLYGTLSAKGEDTEERPHRLSSIVELPETIETVPVELLEKLAAMYVEEKPSTASRSTKKPALTATDKSNAEVVLERCAFLQHCRDDAASLSEWEWYAMLTNIAPTEQGSELCHELSRPYPGYSPKETDIKIQHALKDSGPMTCDSIRSQCDACKGCTHTVASPIVLGIPDKKEEARNTALVAIEAFKEGDKGAVFEPEVIGALALLDRIDPAEFERIHEEYRAAKVPRTKLKSMIRKEQEKWKDEQRAKLKLVQDGDEPQKRTAADENIRGCPDPEFIIPDGYTLTQRGITRIDWKRQETVNVALAPVFITGLVRDIENDKESLRLTWKRHGKWMQEFVDRDVAANARSLVSLSGGGFPVTSGSAGELVTYLAKAEAENLYRFPVAQVSTRMGWQGKEGALGFLWGRTLITPDGELLERTIKDLTDDEAENTVIFRGMDTGDEQLANGYHTYGTLEGWLEAVKLASPYPKALLALYAAFIPPILDIIQCHNFIIDFANRTSTGKTTVQRLAASVVGNADEQQADSVLNTWDATKVWLERASGVITGLPMILDDTKRARNKKLVAEMIYMVGSGKGKARGNKLSLSATDTWRTVLISSGEMPITFYVR